MSSRHLKPAAPGTDAGDKTDAPQLGRIVVGMRLDRARAHGLVNGTTDRNGTVEMYMPGRGQEINDEIVGVTQYDLVFSDGETLRMMPATGRYNRALREDQLIEVFSSFNGTTIRRGKLREFAAKFAAGDADNANETDEEWYEDLSDERKQHLMRHYLYDRFKLVGIANANERFDRKKQHMSTGGAAAIGGTISIRNTGTENILVGNTLEWRIPSSEDVNNADERREVQGIPHNKIVAQVFPFNAESLPTSGAGMWNDLILDQIGGLNPAADSKKILKLASWHLLAASSRCFAVALTSAKPGQMLDVQIARNMLMA